jgi:GntR family transcriptional regulator/MocR family aminotransferase
MKHSEGRLLADVVLDRTETISLHQQLTRQIRARILDGRLTGGTRLPSTRTLTAQLSVSRITIVNVFDELRSEGFLRSRQGDGTYVSEEWRQRFVPQPADRLPPLSTRGSSVLSARGLGLFRHAPTAWAPADAESFVPSQVAIDAFPVSLWKRLLARNAERREVDVLGYCDPLGYLPLREAIAEYLNDARGLGCGVEQVVICSGAQQAFNALAVLLTDTNDVVWLEDPGHIAARLVFETYGCDVRGVPVDSAGANLEAVRGVHPSGRLMVVTPARHHPLGMAMRTGRRLEWINWANRQDAWIIEDDCDSELRYRGSPPPTLFGMDRSQHVIHVGSFSKVMFPSLRVGYAVLPSDLVEQFAATISIMGRSPATILQAATRDFIAEGHLHTHVRRMRHLYLTRQEALIAELEHQLGSSVTAETVNAGMHVVCWLPEHLNDQRVAEGLAQRGVHTYALRDYCLDREMPPALLVGFGAIREEHMRAAVTQLTRALREVMQEST